MSGRLIEQGTIPRPVLRITVPVTALLLAAFAAALLVGGVPSAPGLGMGVTAVTRPALADWPRPTDLRRFAGLHPFGVAFRLRFERASSKGVDTEPDASLE